MGQSRILTEIVARDGALVVTQEGVTVSFAGTADAERRLTHLARANLDPETLEIYEQFTAALGEGLGITVRELR